MNKILWTREVWDASVSAKAYNADWWATLSPEKEPALWDELKSIYEQEQDLPSIPDWASEIVVRMMELPMCGYYAYPDNVAQVINAISAEQCPDVVMTCYTVDAKRKTLLSYYVYCLDAWLKDAPLPHVVAELSLRDSLGKNWEQIASAIYATLGDRPEVKRITIERLIHRLRWWIKSLIWINDKRDRFLLDVYSGDIRGDEEHWGAYGNSPYGDPYFAELSLPHVKEMEERICADVPEGIKLLDRIHSTWLCAPKMFRYLEKLIVEIGAIDSGTPTDEASAILQCENTYPDFEAIQKHFSNLLESLQLWRRGNSNALPGLGERTPEKEWLVHLLWHKLVFHSTYEENFAKLVGERPHGKSGIRKPTG